MTYLILSCTTIPILIFLAAQDFKERMIYSFPVLFLSGAWAVHSIMLYRERPVALILAWIITFALYMVYKLFHIWGDGDSDVFLLFTGIILCTFEIKNLMQFGFLVCICLVTSQVVALIFGFFEAVIQKRKLDRNSDLAVVPGFAMILIVVIFYGITREGSLICMMK